MGAGDTGSSSMFWMVRPEAGRAPTRSGSRSGTRPPGRSFTIHRWAHRTEPNPPWSSARGAASSSNSRSGNSEDQSLEARPAGWTDPAYRAVRLSVYDRASATGPGGSRQRVSTDQIEDRARQQPATPPPPDQLAGAWHRPPARGDRRPPRARRERARGLS